MTSEKLSGKFLSNIWVAMTARLMQLMVPVFFAAITWGLGQFYYTFQDISAQRDKDISEIKNELLEHQFILENGKALRMEFETNTVKQFDTLHNKLNLLVDKLSAVSDSVIRVQTIVETRLPQKAAKGAPSWSQQ